MTMTRWYDSAMAMVRWYWCDRTIWQWSDVLSRHRYRVIAPSRYWSFFKMALDVDIHTNVTTGNWIILYSRNLNFSCLLLSQKFQILSMFLPRYKPEENSYSVMNALTHTGKMEKGNFIRVHYRVILFPWLCFSCIYLQL